MEYTNQAYARIKNNTEITLSSVTLHHQYSDDTPEQMMTWTNVQAHMESSTMTVGYNTGFIRFGEDYWWIEYTLPDKSTWVSPAHMRETLNSRNQEEILTFTITGTLFESFRTIEHDDGGTYRQVMQLNLETSPFYNSWAVILLQNNFPVSVSATLEHKYSGDPAYKHDWQLLKPGRTSDPDQRFIVYFNTGLIRFGSDYWNLKLMLDIPPYDNAPANAFKQFTNATKDKACMLMSSDNGMTHTFSIDGEGLHLTIKSGPCFDQWRTWNSYNTLAFVYIDNKFPSVISTVELTHQYSDDTIWKQTRALIPEDACSPLMVVEFNTGPGHAGFDYWNVNVCLENGDCYRNGKPNKECYMTVEDTKKPQAFSVSKDTFKLELDSGKCSDSMIDKGQVLLSMGRDPKSAYNRNAFIGSHNAYANFAAGFYYAQQTESIETQLALGATTLLLDIWYDQDDIYLKHENYGVLQPFCANQMLSEILKTIRKFLTIQSRDPVTIIFEDRVEAAYQDLIRKAFESSDTWDMVFNPKASRRTGAAWPTLEELFVQGTPLIVFTSNRNSNDFAYQWGSMSENVYGDESLDENTWLNPRKESRSLDKLDLCALNHFPTWTVQGELLKWLNEANTNNATEVVKKLIDTCAGRYNRYPNYINADFWELPENGLIKAIIDLNHKFHPTDRTILRYQHGRPILREIDHSRLLRGDWHREAVWIDEHFEELCPKPAPGDSWQMHQLTDAVNLTLVVGTLQSIAAKSTIEEWVHKTVRALREYFSAIEPQVLAKLRTGFATTDEPYTIPYFLLGRITGTQFQVTSWIRRRLAGRSLGRHHDEVLLAGLAGNPRAAVHLIERLAGTRAETAANFNTSQMYDLTHEVLYLSHLQSDALADTSLAVNLGELLNHVTASNQDLCAELLACYWLADGTVNEISKTAAKNLKTSSEKQFPDCKADSNGKCCRSCIKEQVHMRLTAALGLGTTLAKAGELLS